MIYKPKQTGIVTLDNIDLYVVSKYINWTFFFHAWKISGQYEGIEKVCMCTGCESAWLQQFAPDKQDKAREALQLFKDARQLLSVIVKEKIYVAKATFQLMEVKSENEGIVFYPGNDNEAVYIPMLRQQQKTSDNNYYLSLADFVSPEKDYAGIFAVAVSGSDELREKYNAKDDTYNALLAQTIADRLAEAATEWMHEQIRKIYWGYAPDENMDVKDMLKVKYQGIRPAVGYPSLPDQSVIFDLDKMLHFNRIGISITENGAMHPTASTCGLLMANPFSKYFMIGPIGKDQLADYAKRKGTNPQNLQKWLINVAE